MKSFTSVSRIRNMGSLTVRIQITDIVGSSICVAYEDGQKVFVQIAEALRDGNKVQISFLDIESLSFAFLYAAIGQLYGEFQPEMLKDKLTVIEIDMHDLLLLKRVVDNAKLDYSNPEIL